jgi:CRP-like cAMP-binding protein
MSMDILLALVNQFVTLDEAESAFIESLIVARPCKRNEVIAQSGKSSRYMVLVVSGYVMTYYTDNEGIDHVVQFAGSGWWTGDQNSPALYSTRALSDGEIILLPKAAQDVLMERHIKFERYFRHVFQHALMRMQARFTESHSTAEERYLSFRARYAAIEQHVPQKYIASYLGITPEFLSKIRKKLLRS